MSWNYRIILDENGHCNIHEVYYDKGTKKPYAWTAEPAKPYGETLDELKDDLRYMRAALSKPILKIVDGKLVDVDESSQQSTKTR